MDDLNLNFDKEPNFSTSILIFAKRLLKTYTTLSLSALSGCSYLGAYCYQLGYFNNFQIPVNLIDIQIPDFIYVGFICIVVLIASYMIKILADFRKIGAIWYWEFFISNIVIMVALVFIIVELKMIPSFCLYSLLPLEVIVIIRAALKYKKYKNQNKKKKNSWIYIPSAPLDEDKFYERYRDYFGTRIIIYMLFPVFTIIFSMCLYLVGYALGASQNDFFEIKPYHNMIVIKEAKSLYICKYYDVKSHSLSDSIYLIKADQVNVTVLRPFTLPHIHHNNLKD